MRRARSARDARPRTAAFPPIREIRRDDRSPARPAQPERRRAAPPGATLSTTPTVVNRIPAARIGGIVRRRSRFRGRSSPRGCRPSRGRSRRGRSSKAMSAWIDASGVNPGEAEASPRRRITASASGPHLRRAAQGRARASTGADGLMPNQPNRSGSRWRGELPHDQEGGGRDDPILSRRW
jgi:hypothetical protein